MPNGARGYSAEGIRTISSISAANSLIVVDWLWRVLDTMCIPLHHIQGLIPVRFSFICYLGVSVLASLVAATSTQAGILTESSPTVLYGFNSFGGTGFAPNPAPGASTLNSDFVIATGFSDGSMSFGDTRMSGDFARGTASGGVSTGGVYAFNVADPTRVDWALGVQPTGADFTPGSFVFRVQNGGASDINSLSVGFKAYYFNDQERGNELVWQDSLDNITYVDFGELIKSPAASENTPSWVLAEDKTGAGQMLTINFATSVFAPGDWYYFRFLGNDVDSLRFRDQFAIDDVSFTASFTQAVPEPTAMAIWSMILVGGLARRNRQRA